MHPDNRSKKIESKDKAAESKKTENFGTRVTLLVNISVTLLVKSKENASESKKTKNFGDTSHTTSKYADPSSLVYITDSLLWLAHDH